MEKIQEIFNRHKKAIGIGAAATLSIGLLYLLTKRSGPKAKKEKSLASSSSPTKAAVNQQVGKHETPTNSGVNDSTNVEDTPFQAKAKAIAKKINVETIGSTKTYNLNMISQVLEHSIELVEEEFVSLTLLNRKERRERMQSDIEGYERLIIEFNDEVENLLKKGQQSILEVLNIQYEDFEESVIDFMEKGYYQEIYMFQAAIRQKIKEKIKSTQDLSIEKTKQIIRFQIEILNQQPELLKQLIQKLSASQETVQLIPIVITNLLCDYIYKEFQIEEEDTMKVFAKPEIVMDHEVMMLLQEIEQVMFQLMMPYGGDGAGLM